VRISYGRVQGSGYNACTGKYSIICPGGTKKNGVQSATMKENLIFTIIHTSHKLMLGFQIQIRLDPDLFDQIRILQGAMGVCSAIFHVRIPIGFQVVANPQDLRSLILHLWKHCSTDWSFEKTDFLMVRRFMNLSLGLIYYSIASSQPLSLDTVPFIYCNYKKYKKYLKIWLFWFYFILFIRSAA
jgi:hypothetical protein